MSREKSALASTNKVWLSDLVQTEIEKHYPQLAPDPWPRRLLAHAKGLLPLPILIAIFIFVAFVVLNEILLALGFRRFSYELNAESAGDVLSSYMDYLAAIVGIVIPLIILIVEFLGRDYSEVIDLYLRRTGILWTAVWALLVLGLHAISMLVIRQNLTSVDEFYLYILVLLLLLDLAVLALVVGSLKSVRNFLSNESRLKAFLDWVVQEVEKDLFIELRVRYFSIYEKQLKQHVGLTGASSLSEDYGSAIPLRAKKTGRITDIRLSEWKNLRELTNQKSSVNQVEVGSASSFINKEVSRGDQIVFIEESLVTEPDRLQRWLDRSLRIGKKPVVERGDIERILGHLKQRTLAAAREEDDELFTRFLDVYVGILDVTTQFYAPPIDPIFGGLFPGWVVTRIARQQLTDIIDAAARSRNKQLINLVAPRIRITIETMIDRSDVFVSESLGKLLHLFSRMYSSSAQSDNEVGMNQSHVQLTDNVIDYTWKGKFADFYSDETALRNLKQILESILQVLADITNGMINSYDSDGLGELLNKLQPGELLSWWTPTTGRIHLERWNLIAEKPRSTAEEQEHLSTELRVRESALSVRDEVEGFFDDLVFVASSYVVEGYDRGAFDAVQVQRFLDIFHRYSARLDVEKSVHILLTLPKDLRPRWYLFNRSPDTERGFSGGYENKLFLFYCLRGLQMLAVDRHQMKAPAVDLPGHILMRIDIACNTIASSAQKWSPILNIDGQGIPALAERFSAFNHQMAQRPQTEAAAEEVDAPLEQTRSSRVDGALKMLAKLRGTLSRYLG